MPRCGSQIILCDVPIRFDTYVGCSHNCSYCFVKNERDISKIAKGESPNMLLNFINGKRNNETNWCDWDIPLHWGGMSDPFQPIEKEIKNSLECLKIFAKTKYPFIVSTKNKLISEGPYLSLIKECNCVVQFSAACNSYNKFEKGASSFEERMQAADIISKYKRVNIRIQPYIHELKSEILKSISIFKEVGVYGIIVESMKYKKKVKDTVKIGGDFCYPTKILRKDYEEIKQEAHAQGIKFYAGENRLRFMGDNLCCCGIEGLNFQVNTFNLNHKLYGGGERMEITKSMEQQNSSHVFKTMHQDSLWTYHLKDKTFEEIMKEHFNKKVARILLPDEIKL